MTESNAKRLALTTFIVLVVLTAVTLQQYKVAIQSSTTTVLRRNLSNKKDQEDKRPVIHTFYEKVREGQDNTLEVWKEEWEKAGFDTRILTLDDSKKHPFFKEMQKKVEPIFKSGYNAMCYYRWLAMVTAGGGWMTDYDCLPTNFPQQDMVNLPHNGQFTSYEAHVPSLMSASKDEWLRVTKLLVDAIPNALENKSDMYSFLALRMDNVNHGIHFESPRVHMRRGYMYKSVSKDKKKRVVDCKVMGKGRADHFAHFYNDEAFQKGKFPIELPGPGPASRYRAEAMKVFMNDWREQCGGSSEAQIQKEENEE